MPLRGLDSHIKRPQREMAKGTPKVCTKGSKMLATMLNNLMFIEKPQKYQEVTLDTTMCLVHPTPSVQREEIFRPKLGNDIVSMKYKISNHTIWALGQSFTKIGKGISDKSQKYAYSLLPPSPEERKRWKLNFYFNCIYVELLISLLSIPWNWTFLAVSAFFLRDTPVM